MYAFEGPHQEAMTRLQVSGRQQVGVGGSETNTSECKVRVSHTTFCWGGCVSQLHQEPCLPVPEGAIGLAQRT